MRALAAGHDTLLQLTGAGVISGLVLALREGAVLMTSSPLTESLAAEVVVAVWKRREGFCRIGILIVFCGSVVNVMEGLGKKGKVI